MTIKKLYVPDDLLRNILNEAGREFGIPIERMISRYAPRMWERGIQTWDEAIQTFNLPEDFQWAATMQRTGYLFPQEQNIFRLATAYVYRGARYKFIKPHLDAVSNLRNTAAREKLVTKAELNMIDEYVAKVHGWPTGLDDLLENTAILLTRFVNELPPFRYKRRYENIQYKRTPYEYERKVGKKIKTEEVPLMIPTGEKYPGYFETYDVMSRLMNTEMNLISAGALGFRPYAVIRNTFQSM